MDRNMNHKVGVKLFSEAQLENVLPTYHNLFHKIDACREAARAELESEEKRHYQYNFMYDNVFSILGKRGTGKTSVVFTLQKMISEKYRKQHDVVLPLIIPEAIPENCTVLGWILAIVKEEVKKLRDEIDHFEKRDKEDAYWNKCKYVSGNGKSTVLSDKLDMLSQLFYAGNYNPSNESSYYRAIDNSALQTVDYYRFAQEVAGFWDAWVKEICHLHKLKAEAEGRSKEEKVCPLIYFIFDDVDLAPEKIDEMLSVIIKYLSHPNIIVLTTADEELFLEVIEKRLDKNIGRLPREWRNYLSQANEGKTSKYIMWSPVKDDTEQRRTEDLVSQTTRMYLGKVLPSSTRYYLRLFNTARQKEIFCLEDGKNLGEAVTEQVQQLIDMVGEVSGNAGAENTSKENCVNFMRPESTVLNFYLKFMGNTSRQIANAYIVLQELIENFMSIVEDMRKGRYDRQRAMTELYQSSRYFLNVAIRANHELTEVMESVDDFVDEIFLSEYNQWNMYFNYAFIEEFLKKNLEGDSKQHKVEVALQLYSLFAFQENLLLIMERGVPEGITKRKKVHMVHFLIEYVENIAFESKHVFRDDLHPNVFMQHYVNLLDRLPVIIADKMIYEKFNMEYFYNFVAYPYKEKPGIKELVDMHRNNRKFFAEMTGMVTMVYGNVYLFDKQDMENCLLYTDNDNITKYQNTIRKDMRDNMMDCFGLIKMQAAWKNGRDVFQKAIDDTLEATSGFFDLQQEVKKALDENGMEQSDKKVLLSEIIAMVFEKCKKRTTNPLERNPFMYCSEDILHDLAAYRDVLENRKEKENLILEYIQKINKAEHLIGKEAILFDPSYVSNILGYMEKKWGFMAEQISPIIGLLGKETISESGQIPISKKTYFDIIRIINKVLESGMIDDDSFDMNAPSREELKGVLNSLDIVVCIGVQDEFSAAVEMGLRVLVVEYLQSAYIYQTICDRYDGNNNSSSRDLETTVIDGCKVGTYYFHLFNCLADIQEGKVGTEVLDKKRKSGIELESMRDDIVAMSVRERQRYVNMLLQGGGNE